MALLDPQAQAALQYQGVPAVPGIGAGAGPLVQPAAPAGGLLGALTAPPQMPQQTLFQQLAPAALGLIGTALGGGNTFARGFAGGLNQSARGRMARHEQNLRRWQIEQQMRQAQLQEERRAREWQAKQDAAQTQASRRAGLVQAAIEGGADPTLAANLPTDSLVELVMPQSADPTTLQRNYEMAVSQGYTGTLMDYQRAIRPAGTTVNVNQGGIKVPAGYMLGEDGQSVVPIPGGSADPAVIAEKAGAGRQGQRSAMQAEGRRLLGEFDAAVQAAQSNPTPSNIKAASDARSAAVTAYAYSLSGGNEPSNEQLREADSAVPGLGSAAAGAAGSEMFDKSIEQTYKTLGGTRPRRAPSVDTGAFGGGLSPEEQAELEELERLEREGKL